MSRAQLVVRLTPEQRDQLNAISLRLSPLARRDAMVPAVDHLAARVSETWPDRPTVDAARKAPAGYQPQAFMISVAAREHLTEVARARGLADGLLLRAALRAAADGGPP